MESNDTLEFNNWNSRFKTLISGIASCTPYVGGALSGIVGFLWPSDETDKMKDWNMMKNQIYDLIKELIDQEKIIYLDKSLEGMRLNLETYNSTSFESTQKGDLFSSNLAMFDLYEPFFLDDTSPETTLPYFVSMGTLKITALRDQYLLYEKIYHEVDNDKQFHLNKLQNTIQKYSNAAVKAKQKAINWRLSLITIEEKIDTLYGILGPHKRHTWTVKDNQITDHMNPHISFEKSWEYDELTGGTSDAERCARSQYSTLKSQIESDLTIKLESFLSPSYIWKYLDPTNPLKPKTTEVNIASGPFAGLRGQKFSDNPNGQKITKIIIGFGDRVDGIQIFYGGISGNRHGMIGTQRQTLELDDDENIIAACGRCGDSMDALYFVTNKNRTIGGGGTGGGSAWVVNPPDGTNGVLSFISGVQGTRSLEGITFHWKYFQER